MKEQTIQIPVGLFKRLTEYFLDRPTPEQQNYLFTVIAQELYAKNLSRNEHYVYGAMINEKDPERKKLLRGVYDDCKRLIKENDR